MHQDKAELYVRIVPFTNADHKRIQRNKNNPLQRIKVSNNTTLYTISSYIHGQASSSDQNQLSVSLHVPFSNKCVQLPLSMSVADFLLITNQVKQGELRYRFDKTDEQHQQQLLQQSNGPIPSQQNQQMQINSILPNQILQNINQNSNSNNNNFQCQKSNKLNPSFKQELNFQISSINQPSGAYTYDTNNNITDGSFNNPNLIISQSSVDHMNKININSSASNINDHSLQQQDSPPYPLPDFPQPPMNTDSNNSIFHSVFHMFSNSFNSFPPILDSMNYNQFAYEQNQNAPSKESISLKNDLEQILHK